MKMWSGLEMPDKVRTFTFTNFNLKLDYAKIIENEKEKVGYIAYALETCPKTGRKHHQGWLYFGNPRGWTGRCLQKIGLLFASKEWRDTNKLGKKQLELYNDKIAAKESEWIKLWGSDGAPGEAPKVYGPCHIEPMGGSIEQNDKYCSKAGELIEHGKKPDQGSRGDLKNVIDSIGRGEKTSDDLCISDPVFYHMYGRTLCKAEDILLRKKYRTWMTEGIWYYGETGTGKSHRAFKDFDPETMYVKPLEDDWWDGYTGQGTVILNDFRGQLKYSELLTLIDKWPHSVKRRNREPAPFLAKIVIITSSLAPELCYKNVNAEKDSIKQLRRRCKIYEVVDREEIREDVGSLLTEEEEDLEVDEKWDLIQKRNQKSESVTYEMVDYKL